MNSHIHDLTQGKPLRRTICAALALAITVLTTQVIIHSAGQHEYGMAAMNPAPAPSSQASSQPGSPNAVAADVRGSIVMARSHRSTRS
jgi:hypothetical protein